MQEVARLRLAVLLVVAELHPPRSLAPGFSHGLERGPQEGCFALDVSGSVDEALGGVVEKLLDDCSRAALLGDALGESIVDG